MADGTNWQAYLNLLGGSGGSGGSGGGSGGTSATSSARSSVDQTQGANGDVGLQLDSNVLITVAAIGGGVLLFGGLIAFALLKAMLSKGGR